MRQVLRSVVWFGFALITGLAYRAYSIEGVNALLLVMPAKLIVPTLRRYGACIGGDVQIHSPLIIHNATQEPRKHYANLVIGDHCYFGRDLLLDLKEQLVFEEYVTVSMRCTLLTHTDAGERPPPYAIENLTPGSAPIRVQSGAYLGANCTVTQGVTIGQRAVVGTCALVRHDVQDDMRVAGVPARRID